MIYDSTKEKLIFLTIFVPLALLSWRFVKNGTALTGDGPEYIIAARSIIQDHDLYLENQANHFLLHKPPYWEGSKQKTFNNFPPAPGKIESYFLVNAIPHKNHLLPYHPPGLSFLIAPGVAIFGNWGALLTVAFCAALLGLEFYKFSGSAKKTLLLALSPPLLYLSLLTFKEIPAALLSFAAYRRIAQGKFRALRSKLTVGTLLGFLPWLHPKYILVSAVFYLFLLSKTKLKNTSASAVCTGALTIALFAVYAGLYGNGQALLATKHPGLINPLKGLAGLLFDREYGLILHAPWVLYGLWRFLKSGRAQPVPALIVLIFFAGIASFGNWHGGVAPGGRLVAPSLPFLALFLPKEEKSAKGFITSAAFTASILLAVINIAVLNKPGYINPDGANETWQTLPGGSKITKLFPRVSDESGKLKNVEEWW